MEQDASPEPDDQEAITGIDVENVYGRAHRSTCLKGARQKAPRLVRPATVQWKLVWQRVGTTWRCTTTAREGWRGLHLMQILFGLGLAVAFEGVTLRPEPVAPPLPM